MGSFVEFDNRVKAVQSREAGVGESTPFSARQGFIDLATGLKGAGEDVTVIEKVIKYDDGSEATGYEILQKTRDGKPIDGVKYSGLVLGSHGNYHDVSTKMGMIEGAELLPMDPLEPIVDRVSSLLRSAVPLMDYTEG